MAALSRGEYQLLRQIYREYRSTFFKWASRRSSLGEDDLADLFQDTLLILYKNARAGKLEVLQSRLKTYLFGIGKRLLYERYQAQTKVPPGEDTLPQKEVEEWSIQLQYEQDHQSRLLQQLIGQLSAKCQQLLLLHFYHNYSVEALQRVLGYTKPEAVRVSRHRCSKKLRSLVKENWSKLS
ncbi:MAG: sigma-70 family RNA polymerase sigma factor [Bacteroidota bacterium]